MVKFKLVGIQDGIKLLRRAEGELPAEIKRIVKEITFNDMLFRAQKNAKQLLNRNTTGNLSSNIKPFIQIIGSIINAGLKVDLNRIPGARIHELGGVIKPVKAKALTIPFPGVKGFARDFENTFIAKGIIFQRLGKTKTGRRRRRTTQFGFKVGKFKFKGGLQPIRPLFILKKSVTIPARPYLRPALEATIPEIVKAIKAIKEIK